MNLDTGKLIDIGLLVGALGYFILPADVIPDFLGPIGFIDDGATLSFAFKKAKDLFPKDAVDRAMKETQKIMGDDFNEEKMAKIISTTVKKK